MDFEWASMRRGRMAAVALAMTASGRLRVMYSSAASGLEKAADVNRTREKKAKKIRIIFIGS
jgi:hypothetical protein